ncbi:TPA: Sentrin-specific protease 2, variant 2 [Trebouxia sp. C0004]
MVIAPSAESSISLKRSAVCQQKFAVDTAEATISVQQFLSHFRRLSLQKCLHAHTKGSLKLRQQRIWPMLTARQRRALVLSILIDSLQSLVQQTFAVSVLVCCTYPIAQLVWSACPTFGFSQLCTGPGYLLIIPLADAVWVSYVFQLLLAPSYAYQSLLTMVAMLTLHLDNVPIMLFVALWAINKLAAADSALNKLDPEERKAARKLAMDCTGTPWLLPVHCMVPSAGLIAILLIIGGVEVNPGPFMSIVFTLLMLVTMPSGKRSWSEAEGPSKTDSNPVVVLMPHNPFLDKLTQTDLTGLLDTESALRDEIVNFFLGMLQLQTHSHQPKEWLMLHTFFFEKLYR